MNDTDLATLKRYFSLMNFNGAAQVYQAALACGLLDALDREPQLCEALAQACGTQPRPTELLLRALAALGLVECDPADGDSGDGISVEELPDEPPDRWKLTDLARMLLWGQYRELGNAYWQHLPEFLRTARPLKTMDSPDESEMHYQVQAASLRWMLGPAAESAATALAIGTQRRGLSILDVGAGSAVWSLTIAREDPQTNVTALDWSAVLEVAQETAQMFDVSDALELLAGNYHEVALPADTYDLAIVANVTHLETPERNRSLFRRLFGALKPGGEIAVVDVFPTSDEGRLTTSLYQLGLALRTAQGRVYGATELAMLLQEAGFDAPRLIPLPAPPHLVGMLLAQKK